VCETVSGSHSAPGLSASRIFFPLLQPLESPCHLPLQLSSAAIPERKSAIIHLMFTEMADIWLRQRSMSTMTGLEKK
jgi:hypothetical protein